MVKQKSKKKGLSDMKNEAAIKTKKTMNPFEVHVNRQKFEVLGRKLKTDRGLPGVARAKAIKKRKETLLQEYKVFGKSNKFVDRRIGEFNKDMTAEDKIMARFAAERASSHKKKAMFNLADDEPLTHKGRSIMELETFEDPPSDDDDLFDQKLDGRFTEEAHFGGGMLKKSEGSRMAVIDQLIADSKKRKAEKAAAKEHTLAATEKLDSEWRDLLPVLASSKFGGEENFKKDEYDKILGSLRFEARGTPSDRLKSEVEVAEQEAKRLRELEEDRLRRMNGDMSSKADNKSKHRSADELDDGFELDDDDNEDFVVTYDDDGKLINEPNDVFKNKSADTASGDESEDGDSENEDGSDRGEDESDDDFADLKLEVEEGDKEENVNEEDEGGADDYDSDNDDGDDDNEAEKGKKGPSKEAEVVKRKRNSKLESNETDVPDSPSKEKKRKKEKESNGTESPSKQKSKNNKETKNDETDIPKVPSKEEEQNKKETKEQETQSRNGVDEKSKPEKEEAPSKKKVSFKTGVDMVSYSTEEEPKSIEQLEQMRKDTEKQAAAGQENEKLMATARSELPYTFIVPSEYEEFEELMKDRTLIQQAVIIERMIKCTHPSLKEGNRQRLETLFTFILQRLNDTEYSDTWTSLNTFAPYLFDLTQFSPSHAAEAVAEVLSEKFADYMKKKNHYPYPDTLVFLKLVPLLFPTSDKRHQVTTPAFVFISSLLHTCRPNTRRGIAAGLFLCALLTQYVNLSKRIVPEAITYLNGVLGMATLQVSKNRSKFVPPFLPEYKFLCLDSDLLTFEGSYKMSLSDVGSKGTPVDNEFRVRAVFSALTTLESFISFYSDKPGAFLLFEPLVHTLKPFEFMDRYPPLITRKLGDVIATLDNLRKKLLPPLVKKAAPAFMLRLKEPNIRPVFDKDKGKDEKIRLKRRIKKEAKGVLREIRKDRSFLAGVKYKERKASDEERMRKVKEIYGWGAQQQGELNKLDRIKKRKKFRR